MFNFQPIVFSFEEVFLWCVVAISTLIAFIIFRFGGVLCLSRRNQVPQFAFFRDRFGVAGTICFLGLFFYLSLWFSQHDFWRPIDDSVGKSGVSYTVLRLIFAFYLFWSVYWVGTAFLRLFDRDGKGIVSGLVERIIVGFFAGSAIFRVVMLLLGYANLYYRLSAVLLISPILLFSFGALRDITKECFQKAAHLYASGNNVDRLLLVVLGGLLGFCIFMLFVKFGLYDGDGDYITHYGGFYDEVIFSHGIKPNSWWYQYYYSRGAGITYLGMLLTDKMAPGLVSFVFTAMSSLIMFSLVKRFSGRTIWGMFGAVCYLSAMTAATVVYPTKHHETIGPTIICIVWMTLWSAAGDMKGRVATLIAGALLMTSLAILSAEASVYAIGFLGIYFLWFMLSRNRAAVMNVGGWIVIGIGMVSVNLLLNYWLTGQYAMTPFRLWFPKHIGWGTLNAWISPYMLYCLSEVAGPDLGKFLIAEFPNMDSKYYGLVLYLSVRAERLLVIFRESYLYFIAGGLMLIALLRGIRSRIHLTFGVWPTVVILGLVLGSLLAVNQAQSVIRATGFSGFFLILAGVAAWHFGLDKLGQVLSCVIVRVLPGSGGWRLVIYKLGKVLSGVIIIVLASSAVLRAVTPIYNMKHRIDFVSGRMGLWEAIDADGWKVARPIIEMRREIGMDPLVSYMGINGTIGPGYLVGRGLLNPISYSYGNKWHLISFKDAITAERSFKELGVNYFLLDIGTPIFECAAYAPLFSADTLKQHFAVRWSSGPLYLLTWKDRKEKSFPVPDSLVEKWRGELEKSGYPLKGMCTRLKMICDANQGSTLGIKVPDDLPLDNAQAREAVLPVHILLYQHTKK